MTTLVRPRPVFCIIEHEHRDRALADAVASGRFSFAGETRALGLEPDWLHTDLPSDEEWRIDWVKFYYGLDLADAFRSTGDARYLRAFERLVASFIEQVPCDHDASEVTARRIVNWIYAWQRLPELRIELAGSLAAQARHVRANLSPERNHRTLELYALLIASLALPEVGMLEFAVEQLHENLLADFGPDGVHRERSTHYHCIALRSFAGMRENCRRFGVAVPDGFDERLGRACEFARDCRRPDGTIPALSDADSGDYTELLALAARLLERPDLLESRSAKFVDGGYFIEHDRERYLIFDCGPLGDGGHGHYDALSIEAWAGERPLVLDPGRYSYAEPERRWFRGTAAHNTVTVDGLDQTPYARGRSSLPSARATYLGGFEGFVESPCYDAIHHRRIDGWTVEDTLEAPTSHRYDLHWHLAPGAARIDGNVVHAPGLTLTIHGARAIALEDGWISPAYGVRHAAPVVRATAVGTHARFVTELRP
jgi:uncharacterized heparinase superfamily protein